MEQGVRKGCDKIKDQFVRRAATFEASACWVKNKALLDIHSTLAGISKGQLVLEACCGTGVLGGRLAQAGAKVVGLDISLAMLKQAKKKLNYCVNGQAEYFPFPDNLFDVVVCRQAFHFLDISRAVQEMARITKSGTGRIIISQIVPFGEADRRWLSRIHQKKQPQLRNFLNEQNLKDLLKSAGCRDVVLCEHCIEEPINHWLKDTFLPPAKIEEIKSMFLNAPRGYKTAHKTRCSNGDIFDTMRWVILRGKKA
ncbi:MAG: methyltransferase domain-containing protein [Candidatus Omnitrophota bacterium]